MPPNTFITQTWVDTVRKGWKAQIAPAVHGDWYEVTARLDATVEWLDAFTEDLMFAKGFWVEKQVSPKNPSVFRLKAQVLDLVGETRQVLEDGQHRIRYSASMMDTGTNDYRLDNGRMRKFYEERDPRSPMRAFNASMREIGREILDKADAVFSGKALRALNRGITQNDMGATDKPRMLVRPYERVFNVGRAKVVLQDLPYRESEGPLSTRPREPAHAPKPGEWQRGDEDWRDPDVARGYQDNFKTAQALLERAGLGHVWYGTFFVRCRSCGGDNPHGKELGVGGDYSAAADDIRVYSDPSSNLHTLIIHELGHRYYYRFMDGHDRARFDAMFAGNVLDNTVKILREWAMTVPEKIVPKDLDDMASPRFDAEPPAVHIFTKRYIDLMPPDLQRQVAQWVRGVPATTGYGQKASNEDFAELFMSYVIRTGITRDQNERFEQFLGRTRRHASLSGLYGAEHGRHAHMNASRVASAWLQQTRRKVAWKPTGDGSRVGLFLPLPEEIAVQFASLKPEDDSPPHVTLFYMGEVPKPREQEFLGIVQEILHREPSPIRAQLGQPDAFLQASAEMGTRRVVFSTVQFSRDVASIRDKIRLALQDAGFETKNAFPLAFVPHVTLSYLDSQSDRYVGPVPSGTWSFDSVKVWGLSKEITLTLGQYAEGRDLGVEASPRRWASSNESVRQLLSSWGRPVNP